MMAKVVQNNQRDWPDLLPYVVFCYNATEHSIFHIHRPTAIVEPLGNVDLLLPETQAEKFALPEYAAHQHIFSALQ